MKTQLGVLVSSELVQVIDEFRDMRHLSRSDVVRLALIEFLGIHSSNVEKDIRKMQHERNTND